jgi:hypothetical protein
MATCAVCYGRAAECVCPVAFTVGRGGQYNTSCPPKQSTQRMTPMTRHGDLRGVLWPRGGVHMSCSIQRRISGDRYLGCLRVKSCDDRPSETVLRSRNKAINTTHAADHITITRVKSCDDRPSETILRSRNKAINTTHAADDAIFRMSCSIQRRISGVEKKPARRTAYVL